MTIKELADLNLIAQTLFDKKAANIIAFDVRTFSTMTDFYIIAEGHVDRHVSALGKHVVDVLEENEISPIHVEGMLSGDWVVIDYGRFVVHILTPDMREKYALEELWHQGKIIKLTIDTH